MNDARQTLIEAYFRGDMDPETSDVFRRLMLSDPGFSNRVARYALDEYLLANALSLAAGVEPEVVTARPPRRPWWPVPLAAAAVALVAAGLWWWGGGLSTGAVVARVDQGAGVRCQVSAGRWVDLNVGDEIREGTTVEAWERGKVVLAYVDEDTRITLGRSSKFEIRNLKLAYLASGRLEAIIARQTSDAPFVVETPHATAKVHGTRFGLSVSSPSGIGNQKSEIPLTRLDVQEGQVSLADLLGESVVVNAGEYAVAEKNRPVTAFPESVDYEAVAGRRRQYRGGRVIFRDNFDGAPKGWLPLVAEGPPDAEQKDRLNILQSGSGVSSGWIGIANIHIPDRPTNKLIARSPAADNRQYGCWSKYSPGMRSYAITMNVTREDKRFPDVRSRAIISGIRLPAGVSPRLLAGSRTPELPAVKSTAVRLEYLMTMDDATNAVVDETVYHDGHLKRWTRSRGPADDFKGEFLVATVNGGLLLDDLVIQRLIPDRVTDGLLALYTFREGEGDTIHDVSGVGNPLDLVIQKPTLLRWLDRGIAIDGPAGITSAMSDKITTAWRRSGALTIESWIRPRPGYDAGEKFSGMMDIMSRRHVFAYFQPFSSTVDQKNRPAEHQAMTLAGKKGNVVVHVVSHGKQRTDVLGSVGGQVFSKDAVRILIPGDRRRGVEGERPPWTGEFYLLAIYGRALSPNEIWQNWQAGPPAPKTP